MTAAPLPHHFHHSSPPLFFHSKSTLLNALLGTNPSITLTEGTVSIKEGLEVGYLEQTAVAGTATTLREEVGRKWSVAGANKQPKTEQTII